MVGATPATCPPFAAYSLTWRPRAAHGIRVGIATLFGGSLLAGPSTQAQQTSRLPQMQQAQSSSPISPDTALAAQLRATIASDTIAFAVGHTDFSRYATPGYCLAAVRHAVMLGRRTIAAQEALDTVRHDAVHDTLPARTLAVARACTARFPSATTPASELPHLFHLAVLAAQDTLAEAVLARRLTLTKEPGAKAELLEDAVATYLQAEPAQVAAAEAVLARLDMLGQTAAVVRSRLRAYAALEQYGDSTGDPDRVRHAAAAILTLARAAAALVPSAGEEVVKAYQPLLQRAVLSAPDSVPVLVRRLQQDTRAFPQLRFATMSEDAIVRLLVGVGRDTLQHATTPPLQAAFWFPAPGQIQDTALPKPGRVSLFVELPGDCYVYTLGYVGTPLDPIRSGCQRTYNLVRRWRAQYGARLDLTVVTLVANTVAVLLHGPQPAAEAAKELRWYVFEYLKLPVDHLAVQVLPLTAPLPAPDGRVFVAPPAGSASAALDTWWRRVINDPANVPFRRVYHAQSDNPGGPALVLTGADGRYLYGGGPSSFFDLLLSRALARPRAPMPTALQIQPKHGNTSRISRLATRAQQPPQSPHFGSN